MRNLRPALATAAAALLVLTACADGNPSPPAAQPAAPSHSGHHLGSAPPPQPLRPGERFVDLRMPQAYAPKAPHGGTDEYRCFLVDPKLTTTAYLTGSTFLPQNAAIVHHAIFYRLSPEQATAAESVDARTPGQGWTCFGGAGVDGQTAWVANWAPGTGETLMPAGYGFAMPPGSKLVMQVHYNLLNAPAGTPMTDRSGIQLRLADGAGQLGALETALIAGPIELPCEPGGSGPLCDRKAAVADVAKRFGAEAGQQVQQLNQMCNAGARPVPGNTQHCDRTVDQPMTILMAGGHMHLLGRSIKVEVNPGTPAAQTVVDVPSYDFDNQALVPLAKPVTVKAGDTVRVTCTHDATLRKQLPQLKGLPSRYVVWGDGTSDEMCLGVMVVTTPK
ncbi:monooxygenase [Actinoplanes sp. N902-109]|uniref:monooxygenase n=1 Tax=Actinoplanes sp. (strain N902-109) TaxID=649831 RepID=UPI0003295E85|nr:monooxygenase [Actinoplanes sp. N902-109]AGL17304.1 monooxygenase [Actinoplanes sp. N902-109]